VREPGDGVGDDVRAVTAELGARRRSSSWRGTGCPWRSATGSVSLLAIWLTARPPSPSRPRGYPNATNIAALVNAGWLLIFSAGIAAAAIWHLAAGTHRVQGLAVLIVSAIAAAVMLIGALILGGGTGGGYGRGPATGRFSCGW
jgi:hypothetical protein